MIRPNQIIAISFTDAMRQDSPVYKKSYIASLSPREEVRRAGVNAPELSIHTQEIQQCSPVCMSLSLAHEVALGLRNIAKFGQCQQCAGNAKHDQAYMSEGLVRIRAVRGQPSCFGRLRGEID